MRILPLEQLFLNEGHEVLGNPERIKSCLESCKLSRYLFNILMASFAERIPHLLIEAEDIKSALSIHSRHLQIQCGLTPDAANEAVNSWANALNVLIDPITPMPPIPPTKSELPIANLFAQAVNQYKNQIVKSKFKSLHEQDFIKMRDVHAELVKINSSVTVAESHAHPALGNYIRIEWKYCDYQYSIMCCDKEEFKYYYSCNRVGPRGGRFNRDFESCNSVEEALTLFLEKSCFIAINVNLSHQMRS